MEGTIASESPGFFRGTITSNIDDIKDDVILQEKTQLPKKRVIFQFFYYSAVTGISNQNKVARNRN